MVTFVSLCLITYVILSLVTFHPACRPAVFSVLVTLPPPTLLLVCSFLVSFHDVIPPTHTSVINCLRPTSPQLTFTQSFLLSVSSVPGYLYVSLHPPTRCTAQYVKKNSEGFRECDPKLKLVFIKLPTCRRISG